MVSVSSRTAYVLLAEIEDAFRTILLESVGSQPPNETLPEDRLLAARDRRTRDGFTSTVSETAQLVPYIDFQDSYELLMTHKQQLDPDLRSGLQRMGNRVAALTQIRNRVAHNRPLEAEDLPITIEFAEQLLTIPGRNWSQLRESVNALGGNRAHFYQSTAHLSVDDDVRVAHNLPAPDYDETSLLGRRSERVQIRRALYGSWPVISILGDGGIGKTALALQVCYDLLEAEDCPFEAIVWVSAKNSQLTSTEIVRIENAVSDSLGLFASATEALGGGGSQQTAVTDLLEVLSAFPILLVLDNVETVLDERFPELLTEIPVGSKVLITSRIGVKTENPHRLHGLSAEDSTRIMRIIARARGIDLASIADQQMLEAWAKRMNHHPAHIKWFMSGLQTGRTPEQLLSDDGLLLDFCMSNVFEYLSEDARAVLRTMVVVPGSHTMAELAFLAGFDPTRIQLVLLELTTTNFVTQVRGGAAGTAHELNDFARRYLQSTLQIETGQREFIQAQHAQLYVVGGGIQAAHRLDPYSPDTIDVRGVGDYSAARTLREAIELANSGRVEEGLVLCAQAAELAPGYHEAARIEGQLHEASPNFPEAYEAYSRAKDLAPEDPYVAYFMGSFLTRTGFDRTQGLRELQRSAKASDSSTVRLAITAAHLDLGDYGSAVDAALLAVESAKGTTDLDSALFYLWRAGAYHCQSESRVGNWPGVAEAAERLVEEAARELTGSDHTLDLVLWVADMCTAGAADCADDYIATRLAQLADKLQSARLTVRTSTDERRVGVARMLSDRGYGFISHAAREFFFHASAMMTRSDFDRLAESSVLAFTPVDGDDAKPRARAVHWIG